MTSSFAFAHPFYPVLALLLCSSLARPDRAAAADVRALIDNAVKSGAHEVVLPPGTYRLGPQVGYSQVVIHDARNLKIVADGVTLIGTELARALSFERCRNVTLQGLTVDYDPLPFTQGVVARIAPDFSSIDVDLDDGYPRAAYERIDVCDPKTRHRKRGVPFLWNTRAAMVGEKTVRVTLPGIGKAAAIGDPVSLNTGPKNGRPPHAVSVDDCAGMVFDHVTVFSAPGFGIVESDGDGGMRYTHCRVVPGPKPAGATAERLLSSSWDAIQTKTTKHGPTVEDCEIRSAGDDSWSVQSTDYVVAAADGSTAVLIFRDPYCDGPQPGDRLARSLASPQPVVVTASVVNLEKAAIGDDIRAKMKSAQPWDYWRLGGKAMKITVTGAFPFAVGDSVYCPDRQCNGFVFRNNHVYSPGRLLVKASDGLIENNEVTEGHSGVTVNPEVPGEAASGMANLIIRHNHFTGTGYFCPLWSSSQAGCVSISADGINNHLQPAGIYENIAIEDNRFDDILGPAIVISSARGVTIQGNTFCHVMMAKPDDTGGRYAVDPYALIWLNQCEQVKLSDNRVYEPGAFLKDLVAGLAGDQSTIQNLKAGVEIRTDESCPKF